MAFILLTLNTVDAINEAYQIFKRSSHRQNISFCRHQKQAQAAIKEAAKKLAFSMLINAGMAGMLTNMQTISRALRR
jgi:ribosomal protein S2